MLFYPFTMRQTYQSGYPGKIIFKYITIYKKFRSNSNCGHIGANDEIENQWTNRSPASKKKFATSPSVHRKSFEKGPPLRAARL